MPLSPAVSVVPTHYTQPLNGHNRWHPDISAVAEVISGGSVRLECPGRPEAETGAGAGEDDDPASDVMLCGPVAILGAEPGDILVIDILGVGRGECRDPAAHPGIIGCAPGREPGNGPAPIARCAVVPLATGSRALLPVHACGAKLSVGDLHFPHVPAGGDACRGTTMAGWVDLRINLTKRGMERFRVSRPLLMSEPAGP
jgi:acetamidase/formamidase